MSVMNDGNSPSKAPEGGLRLRFTQSAGAGDLGEVKEACSLRFVQHHSRFKYRQIATGPCVLHDLIQPQATDTPLLHIVPRARHQLTGGALCVYVLPSPSDVPLAGELFVHRHHVVGWIVHDVVDDLWRRRMRRVIL